MNSIKYLRADKSVALLIFSNLVTIAIAALQKWDVRDVMWIYWGQSVIIGIFNWRRILDLKQFSTKGFRINDRPVQPTRKTQVQTAWFFLFHYGFFHFIYLTFLLHEKNPFPDTPVLLIVVPILTFLINHGFSYRYNRKSDRSKTPNIGTIMFSPYARIIPMHLTILFGSQFATDSGGKLFVFLGLKTLADVIMHMLKHSDTKTLRSIDIE
jgi:hypothetical protein